MGHLLVCVYRTKAEKDYKGAVFHILHKEMICTALLPAAMYVARYEELKCFLAGVIRISRIFHILSQDLISLLVVIHK